MTVAIERDPIYRGRRCQSEIIDLCVRCLASLGQHLPSKDQHHYPPDNVDHGA